MSQPDAPLTADALRVGETVTRYEGDPIVTAEDTDGDGVVDRRSWDVDADGYADLVAEVDSYSGREFVTQHDGYTRAGYTTIKDDDQDGRLDTLMRDVDGDGTWDRFDRDVDGDGQADRYGYDMEGVVDPEPTRWVDRQPEARDDRWVDDAVADPMGAGGPVPAQDAAIPEYVPDPVYAPAVGGSALELPVTPDPGYGSGADERETDYEQEAVNAFADTLQAAPAPERFDAMTDTSPYEAPVGADQVEDASASPVLAPVAEASQADDAMADPDDDAYMG
jgi:hypothetical protein